MKKNPECCSDIDLLQNLKGWRTDVEQDTAIRVSSMGPWASSYKPMKVNDATNIHYAVAKTNRECRKKVY